MVEKNDDNAPISARKFIDELWRYKQGSVSRRHFLGVTGLGAATAVMASAMPMLAGSRKAHAGSIGDRVSIANWPNYFDPQNYKDFTTKTGAEVQLSVFGSNEEMMAKLQAGGTGWDIIVPTNYTIENYVALDLIQALDLSRLPNFDAASYISMFSEPGIVDGKVYAVPKAWGTTGYSYDTNKLTGNLTTWKEFWDLCKTDADGRAMVHDYQLTTIGNALKYFGHSFNSVDPKELGDAEKLLLEVKPHLFAITSDIQPSMLNGDAWMSMAWSGDGLQMNREKPEINYVLGKEGGEIWSDFYAIPKSAPHLDAAYAFIDFLLDPKVNAKEVLTHGYPTPDKRATALLPSEMKNNPIFNPAKEMLTVLEFGAAVTMTDPLRAEIIARFKSA